MVEGNDWMNKTETNWLRLRVRVKMIMSQNGDIRNTEKDEREVSQLDS